MKYDIFNPETKRVLGWAATVDSAERRAAFFIDRNPRLQIRTTSNKKVVKEVTRPEEGDSDCVKEGTM